ncbi:hypothetical protein [Acinetobacter sp. YH01009]|uniref:hypothetical protein n=1 Tax=Acinetobacter TaxID=469 RepID=UPI0015D0F85B|nr:hypothetical protein [Acinetobacter sp. YH01009]
MKVKLTLNSDVTKATSLKFAKSKEIVPDTARYMYVFFGEQISLSDLLVNLTNFFPSLKLTKDEKELTVQIPGSNPQFVEFVVNLKLLSIKIGRLMFEFERELVTNPEAINSFIKRHNLSGFNLIEFKDFLSQQKYIEALDLLCKQYENLKKIFYVLHYERYSLLESQGYI